MAAINPFLTNVHTIPELSQLQIGGKIRPVPIRPIVLQKILAVNQPHAFLRAVAFYLPQYHSSRYCIYAICGRACPEKQNCKYAGSLAEMYASQISKTPFYKTSLCKFENECKDKEGCFYGHSGDLMRRVVVIGNQVITTGLYLSP